MSAESLKLKMSDFSLEARSDGARQNGDAREERRPVELGAMSMALPPSQKRLLSQASVGVPKKGLWHDSLEPGSRTLDEQALLEESSHLEGLPKINRQLRELKHLAEAVEPANPGNARHMRDAVELIQQGISELAKDHASDLKNLERDPLLIARESARNLGRKSRMPAQLQRLSVALERRSVKIDLPDEKPPKASKRWQWVEAAAIGAVSITILIILSMVKDRLPDHEDLQNVYSASKSAPLILPIDSSPLDVVEVVLTTPPWENHEADSHLDTHEEDTHEDPETVHAPEFLVSIRQRVNDDDHHADESHGEQENIDDSHNRKLLSGGGGPQPISAAPNFTFVEDDWVTLTRERDCEVEKKSQKCHFKFRERHLNSEFDEEKDLFLVVSVKPSGQQLSVEVHVHQFGVLGDAKVWIALIILLTVLVLIALEIIHRTLIAMAGSFAMLALLLWLEMPPDLGTVLEWVDESALALLFGMMILVGKLSQTGFFQVATVQVVGLCKGSLWVLTVIMCTLTAVLSAFLDNVTTVLLIAPVTVQMAQVLEINPVPLLIAEVIFSNIGGCATMIGDPPNIIIGNALEDYIDFIDFLVYLAPGVIIMSPFVLYFLRALFRGSLSGPLDKYQKVLNLKTEYKITDPHLLMQTGIVLGVVILAFLLHPVHHVNVAWISILGAVMLMLLSSPTSIHKDLEVVEWDTLLFFAALFVMVEAMGEVGLIREIGNILTDIIESVPESSRKRVATVLIMWVSALVSGFLDNIPYTATMVPVIKQLSRAGLGLELETLAWALAFGACLGGNGSLVGASANIVVAGIAEKAGHHISFMNFLRYGFPSMLVSVAIATGYLLLRT